MDWKDRYDKIKIELNDTETVEIVKRCAHCTFMTWKRSNGYKLLCEKYGPKKLNDVCDEFEICEVLVESLKTSKVYSFMEVVKELEARDRA